ncbi:MAG: TetR/AcrR family transcriptional regulator [Anaerolineales bacterium]|nr:TetR/AcrR family transcriptional regulator [Anaerolineales bacterium]
MPTQKLDRRVRRTHRLLGQALLDLILEQDYDSISITDITNRADLNRATFYLHFGSKEELLIATLEERFDELVQEMEAHNPNQPTWETLDSERLIFEHVAEHAAMYRVLLGEGGVGYVAHRIISYIANEVAKEIRAEKPTAVAEPIPIDIIAQHVAGSTYALLCWWLANDMPYTPAEMAHMAQKMCFHGTMWALMEMQVINEPLETYLENLI